jgi:serine phosphatase RsbU (regulator of sigma subunit)
MGSLCLTYYLGNNIRIFFEFAVVQGKYLSNSVETGHRILIYGALILLVALGILFFVISLVKRLSIIRNLLWEKEQSLELIAQQKAALELREKSITDSLIYAQRIQEARLPSEEYFRNHFPSSFIFFKPKDIVSGDFYWIGEKGERIFVVAADCTGHGVSGALMSMIGMEIIEKAIVEDNIETPSVILGALNQGLEKTFSRKKNIGTIIRDGMDVGLCIIDKQNRKIIYSGAFFPLYLLRNKSLTQINGDRIIIGMNPDGITYTDHEVDIQEDDMFYLFSDGYVDQFGGKENRKFMYRRLRYLLLNIHEFDVRDQKSILEENIKTWMGTNQQVDDMMIIGFKPLEKVVK